MVVLTGDTHGKFNRVWDYCKKMTTSRAEIMVILGDAGINFSGGARDEMVKRDLRNLPITLLCVHGNHEMRPESAGGYEEIEWHGGIVYVEPQYPNLLFAKDGEVYDIAGQRCIVIGGAYSVDKPYRLARGWPWFADEQPSEEIKARVEQRLAAVGWKVDIVLSHTCPLKYEPTETFIKGIDQSGVDKSTEIWLDSIEEQLAYEHWYCAHYHIAKKVDRVRFLFENFKRIS
ncbi:MAG: metallophosphoesterase [Firmicutes bacterium]|nr:metallophosphoesterase [Bacillota bacterium]